MNLQWTSINDIIINLEVTYNIKSDNYINKLPLWVVQALANYRVYIPMEAAVVELPIERDGMVIIPADVKTISGLSYKNVFAHCGKAYRGLGTVPTTAYDNVVSVTGFQKEIIKDEDGVTISSRTIDTPILISNVQSSNDLKYFINNNRILSVMFGEEGETVKLFYVRIPHTYDVDHGGLIPMIPDNEVVKQNITWFILQNLLYSGYSHPTLNLGSAMPYLNPAKMYESTFAKARSTFLISDRADYGKLKNLFTTLVHSYSDPSANLQQH